ncbi:MAG: hypothetical protein GWO19_06305, partial [Nitrospinaceae bacterium]|nr:hypothetical protein [Nitrospinaceae bacterium]NIU95853.1 hypothetical protein [Nitrospinaceae bacterium]
LQTREVPLEVQSVLRLQGEPTDVRGIKPIEPVGGDGWRYLLWTLAALAAAAGGVWLWKNRRRGAVLSSEPPPPPAPHERALRDLETLQSRRLMTQGQIREHYFLLSEIFRRYLGDRYGFPALDWTREEIVAQLERVTPLSPDLRQRVGDILQRTDQVKFARAQVDPADDGIQDIVRFIEITRPREEASAAPTERVQVS